MSDVLASDDLRRRMHQEHRTLRTLQEDLTERFESFRDDPSETTHQAMVDVFRDFRASVLRHFEFEERDGYLGIVTERRPHHAQKVDQLQQEHGAIAEILDRLADELKTDILHDVVRYNAFLKDLIALMTQFGRHEQAERELVMDVFWLEGGVSD